MYGNKRNNQSKKLSYLLTETSASYVQLFIQAVHIMTLFHCIGPTW